MDTLLTAFELIELVAVGGSMLALGAFEISDALVDHKRMGTMNRNVVAVATPTRPQNTDRPVALQAHTVTLTLAIQGWVAQLQRTAAGRKGLLAG